MGRQDEQIGAAGGGFQGPQQADGSTPAPGASGVGRRGFLQAASAGGTLAAVAMTAPTSAWAAADAVEQPLPPLPTVRVTPPVSYVSRVAEHQVSLDGTWSFSKVLPEGFTGRRDELPGWDEVQVPGHFALQGFGRMYTEPYVPVGYLRTFAVPADWAGQRVVLRFAEVDGLAEVWVNGTKAGSSDSAYLPSEFDITDLVAVGADNEVAVAVSRSELTSWSQREMGGITEPVTLQALPQVNLARLHVSTRVDADGATVMRVHLRVANQSDEVVEGPRVQLALQNERGVRVRLGRYNGTVALPTLAAGEVLEHVLDVPVPGVERWDPEHPNLYRVSCTLRAGRYGAMTAERRFGFCTVEVDGLDVRVNGAAVKLRGANTHYAWPGFDFHPPTELMRRDVEIFRDANLNYLRPRLTAISRYVEVCEEVGMLISMDASMSLAQYNLGYYRDRGDNDRLPEPYLRAMATMVETHLSSPAVVLWSTANEFPYYDYFQAAAVGIRAADTTGRVVSHSADQRAGVGIPGVTANDDHYPGQGRASLDEPGVITGGEWDEYPTDRPIIFTEWCHVHMYNKFEEQFDPGIFDYWGHYVHTHTEYLYRQAHVLGSVIFTGSPLTEIASSFDMGFFDSNRRVNDSYWHTLKASSPVRLAITEATRDGAGLVVPLENRYDFSDLSELEVTWTRGGESGRVNDLAVAPRSTGTLRLPVGADRSQPLQVEFRNPKGYLVDRVRFFDEVGVPGLPAAPSDPVPQLVETDTELRITGDGFALVVDRRNGEMTATVGDRPVLVGAPTLSVNRTGSTNPGSNRPVVQLIDNWSFGQVTAEQRADGVRLAVEGSYSRARGGWTLDVRSDGLLTLTYDFEYTDLYQEVFDTGMVWRVPNALSTLSWQRQALWTAYPDDHVGRPRGTAPLSGDPRWTEAREALQEGEAPPWPWSQDIVEGASRDFRSTKANVTVASLTAADGAGVHVLSDGTHHVHAYPDSESEDLLMAVNVFANGGTDRFLVGSVRIDRLEVFRGAELEGTMRLRLGRP